MGLDYGLRDSEPDTRASGLAVARVVSSVEAVKDLLLQLVVNTFAAIYYLEDDLVVLGIYF